MVRFIDARIPVVFGAQPGPGDAVLTAAAEPAHAAGCACCLPRGPFATALDQLFLQRVRGEVPWFTRVVVTADEEASRSALQADPVLSARFRLA